MEFGDTVTAKIVLYEIVVASQTVALKGESDTYRRIESIENIEG